MNISPIIRQPLFREDRTVSSAPLSDIYPNLAICERKSVI